MGLLRLDWRRELPTAASAVAEKSNALAFVEGESCGTCGLELHLRHVTLKNGKWRANSCYLGEVLKSSKLAKRIGKNEAARVVFAVKVAAKDGSIGETEIERSLVAVETGRESGEDMKRRHRATLEIFASTSLADKTDIEKTARESKARNHPAPDRYKRH